MASKNTNPTDWTTVRLPKEVAAELRELGVEMLEAYVQGRSRHGGFCELGDRGCWIPAHVVIKRCLDHFKQHRARARKPKKRTSDMYTSPCNGLREKD